VPTYIHSDRGSSFVSHEVRSYFRSVGVATSNSTPYDPTGNAQVERQWHYLENYVSSGVIRDLRQGGQSLAEGAHWSP